MKLEANHLSCILLLVWSVLFITIPLLVNNEEKIIWQIVITAVMLGISLIIKKLEKHKII